MKPANAMADVASTPTATVARRLGASARSARAFVGVLGVVTAARMTTIDLDLEEAGTRPGCTSELGTREAFLPAVVSWVAPSGLTLVEPDGLRSLMNR
jgi:hypothetical protein